MVYTVELSLYKNKEKNTTHYNKSRREQADKYNCQMQYFMHELEGYGNNIKSNEYIHIVIFDSFDYENVINYLIDIRKEKISYIECVYRDDTVCDILYCSPRYLKRLDKNSAKTIKYNIKKLIDNEQKQISNIIKCV